MMKVIPERRRAHTIIYLHALLILLVVMADVIISSGGLLDLEGFPQTVIIISAGGLFVP
jgi:hypothetical protein